MRGEPNKLRSDSLKRANLVDGEVKQLVYILKELGVRDGKAALEAKQAGLQASDGSKGSA